MSTVLNMREAAWRRANTVKAEAEEAYLNAMDPDADPSTWPDRERVNTLWNAIIEANRIEAEAYSTYRATLNFVERQKAAARNN